jgi:SAM-dependent methyltransferase
MTRCGMSEFDRHAREYESLVQDSLAIPGLDSEFFASTKALELGRLLPKGSTSRVLDVGCGIGALHRFVAPLCSELTGVDVSAESIAAARAANASHTYEVYDGVRLPFPEQSFDLAFAVCVLHHVPPDQWSFFVDEMARVVAPGGLVAIIEHNPFNPLTLRTVRRCPFDKDAVLLPKTRTVALLKDAGLLLPRARFFPFLPLNGKLARVIDHWLAWLPLGAQYIASASVSS